MRANIPLLFKKIWKTDCSFAPLKWHQRAIFKSTKTPRAGWLTYHKFNN